MPNDLPPSAPLPDGSILLVSEPLTPGFFSVYAHSLMVGLSEVKTRHPLITSTRPAFGLLPETELPNVQVVNGLFWSFWRPFIFRKLVSWVAEKEPVLIHGLSAFTAPVCARLAEALDLPYVITVQHFQNRGGLRIEKQCRGFIAVSEPIRENLVNDAHIPREMVRLIPAGIRMPRQLPPMRGGTHTVPLVSSFGRLIRRKDYLTFLNAVRLVVDKVGSQCSFVIAGEGPEESALRKQARDLSIDKQVTFCHGSASHEEVLRDTDVYVQCSRSEGFGTMVLQAMAHGVPVVGTSTGGILSLIKDGETGFLFPVGDAEALAARIVTLLVDGELRMRLGQRARELALANYNLDDMMSATLGFFSDCVGVARV